MKDETLKSKVGKRLKDSRKAAGYTQAYVAGMLKMTQQQYSRFENGVFELNYSQIVFLCRLFDVSANYLFGLDDF